MPKSDTQFRAGQSGNPGGRQKGVERRFRELAEAEVYTGTDGKEYRGVDMLARWLLEMAHPESENSPRDRREALALYLDRAVGRVKQTVKIEDNDDAALDLDDLSDDELAVLMKLDRNASGVEH